MFLLTYSIKDYKKDIDTIGFEKLWNKILQFVETTDNIPELLKPENFGELYEAGLSYINQDDKKSNGQFFTPKDVSNLLADFSLEYIENKNICDVACGTGNLILTLFQKLDKETVVKVIKEGRLYLYDTDKLAMHICAKTISYIYGEDTYNYINQINEDFLLEKIKLPDNSFVISNPPYFRYSEKKEEYNYLNNTKTTKELYALFMEKIIAQSDNSVIITPHSFLNGKKFYNLRKFLNDYEGFIFSFDNIPGSIFHRKPTTLFPDNQSVKTRAAITVVNNKNNKGFRVSQFYRFQNDEKSTLLQREYLMNNLSDEHQLIDEQNTMYRRQLKELDKVYSQMVKVSYKTIESLIDNDCDDYILYMPLSCRYFTGCSKYQLKRDMVTEIHCKNEESFYFIYTILNSDFGYWFYRMYDGGMSYPYSLFLQFPNFINCISGMEMMILKRKVCEIISREKDFIVTKKNAGKIQENIKFSDDIRKEFNMLLLYYIHYFDFSNDGDKDNALKAFELLYSKSIL